jgi:branched-chain amino acid transport system ATP-binding protein
VSAGGGPDREQGSGIGERSRTAAGANREGVLELRGFSAGYRGVPVVHDIDLRVDAGEVVALLGPNGAGKTTTLLTASGLLPRIGGTARVLGADQPPGRTRDTTRIALALVRRGVAHVPEDRALFFGLTGREHLRLAARRRDHEAIELALAPFPALAAIIDRRAGLMSGGEQQMLALARALAGRPKLLMIDELSLGLAPRVIDQLLPLVRTIAKDSGAGVLLVEQNAHAALAVADRAYVIVGGRISDLGAAGELAADTQRLAVTYLGAMPPPKGDASSPPDATG